jgi:hypothetical protein
MDNLLAPLMPLVVLLSDCDVARARVCGNFTVDEEEEDGERGGPRLAREGRSDSIAVVSVVNETLSGSMAVRVQTKLWF